MLSPGGQETLAVLSPSGIPQSSVHSSGGESGSRSPVREPLPDKWRLHPEVISLLLSRFVTAATDLFASAEMTHHANWFSLRAQGAPTDVLSQEWPEGLLYAFLPLPLIPHVLNRVATGHHKVLRISPWC